MGFFGPRKKDVIDLTEGYNRGKSKASTFSANKQGNETSSGLGQGKEKSSDSSGFMPLGFFSDSPATKKESFSENSFDSGDAQERRRKLAKRLVDMTDKIEDVSNQIYHLQQRLELLERKINPNSSVQDF